MKSNQNILGRLPKILSRFGVILLAFVLLSGCNKTNKFEDLDLLINKEWKLISISTSDMDITRDCDTDDILFLEESPDFDYDRGDEICDDELDEKEAKKWKLIKDFSQIRLTYKFKGEGSRGSLVEYWEILDLKENLLLIQEVADGNDLNLRVRSYTY